MAAEDDSELEEIRRRKRERLQHENDADGDDGAGREVPSTPVHVEGQSHLSRLVEDYRLVLVDYYADWCGPCKALEPVVESVAAETEAVVAKVDIDAHQQLAAEQNVRGVPTLVLYADGDPVERLVGLQDEAKLRSLVETH